MGIEHGVDLDGVLAASGVHRRPRRPRPAQPDVPRGRPARHAPAAGNGRRARGVEQSTPTTRRPRCADPSPRCSPSTLLTLLAAPVAAKEWLEARLDAPIAMDTPGGTEILVGITVTAPTEDGHQRRSTGRRSTCELTGRYGDTTRAAAAQRPHARPLHRADRRSRPAARARRDRDPRHDRPADDAHERPVHVRADHRPDGAARAAARRRRDGRAARGPRSRRPGPGAGAVADARARAGTASADGRAPRGARDRRASAALAIALVARRRHAADPTPRSA